MCYLDCRPLDSREEDVEGKMISWAKVGRMLLSCFFGAAITTVNAQPPLGAASADPISIESPSDDVILCDATPLHFSGRCQPKQSVRLKIGNEVANVIADDRGVWGFTTQLVATGTVQKVCVVATTDGASPKEINVWIAKACSTRAQRVLITWESEALKSIMEIAKRTLVPEPSAADLTKFREAVQIRTETQFFSMLSSWNIIPANEQADDVYALQMIDLDHPYFFGFTRKVDAWNKTLNDSSEVYVKSVCNLMIDEFPNWGPMKREDSLAMRIDDVSAVLSRIAVHEFGHAIGLVLPGSGGCLAGHNCPTSTSKLVRFGQGWEIMDPGDPASTPFYKRLGEEHSKTRSPNRRYAAFNQFNRSYLDLIHPHP
jgi:hypothetical protein